MAIKEKLDADEIRPYYNYLESLSEHDKFERSELLGDPIYKREDMIEPEAAFSFIDEIGADGNIETIIEELPADMGE